ncbi:T9SS type A sorting domain-containing protein [Abyssalbus ytuae]|uniref:T9SS type A sorting domain-containing protein n=1 Tax=Abyssalbus ytuae TaxID=2926907 RepID=A0A9E6ZPV0_9FLAO|nr:T9SS type A sorting domain-containing protein [Abyssalbus ytuae]UOB18345.1 T9SS type A sorting domain-containing protein [Abyssalbus ytuae]
MKQILPTVFFIMLQTVVLAQSAFHNLGNVHIYEDANVGIHTNLINNGDFVSTSGLVGLYNEETITVSGTKKPVFYDLEVMTGKQVALQTPVVVTNTHNFVEGNVVTDKANPEVYLEFKGNSIHIGENDRSHVNGCVSVSKSSDFSFPIGDGERMREISIEGNTEENTYAAAYFYTSPEVNGTNDFKEEGLAGVSKKEYWKLKGKGKIVVTLTWDKMSDVVNMTNSINNLSVVGWSKSEKQWVNLGNFRVSGDLFRGSVTSESFIPNDFSVITIGVKSGIFKNISNVSSTSEVVKVNIFDVAGNLVGTVNKDENLDLRIYAKGIYILDMKMSDGKRLVKKVLNK